jgi:glycosyltransferase involved in cell wall biosynthesis
MKVIQVLNHFLPNQTAGTEIYTWALSKELLSSGIEVKVLIPNYGERNSFEYNYDGIFVHQYPEPSIVDRDLMMGFREPEGLVWFSNFLELERPDIVHFHELAGSNGIGLAHVREAKRKGMKVVMTFHLSGNSCRTGTLMYKGKHLCSGKISDVKCSICYLKKRGLFLGAPIVSGVSKLFDELKINSSKWGNKLGTLLGSVNQINSLRHNLHELIDLCDQVVSLTYWYQNVLKLNGIDLNKITLIQQGLPTKGQQLDIVKRKSNCLKLMFLGRVSHFKGLHLLIDAIEKIPEDEVELTIFGNSDGTGYENDLREKTKHKLNIIWAGNLRQEMVLFEMNRHDLLCLCSTFSEMSPLVIQEARAARLPIIASNVYGNKEQLENGAGGVLFEMNNVNSLKGQILKILSNRDLLEQYKKQIELPNSFKELGKKYINIYHKILTQ